MSSDDDDEWGDFGASTPVAAALAPTVSSIPLGAPAPAAAADGGSDDAADDDTGLLSRYASQPRKMLPCAVVDSRYRVSKS